MDKMKKDVGDTMYTVGELKEFLNTLDDNDLIVLEAIDDNGDVKDLYPFHMDIIGGIELEDGSIVNEVRICQEPNQIHEIKKGDVERCVFIVWHTLGIDTPANHDEIVDFIYRDVCETADPIDWNQDDVDIAFRRWIEKQNNS